MRAKVALKNRVPQTAQAGRWILHGTFADGFVALQDQAELFQLFRQRRAQAVPRCANPVCAQTAAVEFVDNPQERLKKLRLCDLAAVELQLRAKLFHCAGQRDQPAAFVQRRDGCSSDLGKDAGRQSCKAQDLGMETDGVSPTLAQSPFRVKGALFRHQENPLLRIRRSAGADFRNRLVRISFPIAAVSQVKQVTAPFCFFQDPTIRVRKTGQFARIILARQKKMLYNQDNQCQENGGAPWRLQSSAPVHPAWPRQSPPVRTGQTRSVCSSGRPESGKSCWPPETEDAI